MEIHSSARRHGVNDLDIQHAVEHSLAIEAFADEAEAGYDVDHLVERRNKRGRPTLGAGPASVESVRLDPELKNQLLLRAEQDHTSPSDVIREALRRYLQPS